MTFFTEVLLLLKMTMKQREKLKLCGRVSQVSQMVKNPFAMEEPQEKRVWSLDWENPLGEEMATHSNILAWEIPLAECLAATVHGVRKELGTT